MNEEPVSTSAPTKSILTKISNLLYHEPKNTEELRQLVSNMEQKNIIGPDALAIINGALEAAGTQVREIMVPRPQMITITVGSSITDILDRVTQSSHSRFPVISDEDPNEVMGILLAKDLLPLLLENKNYKLTIKDHIRPTTFIPESKRLNVLLKEFRTHRNHMAIVVNEYGGVAGLVTIEDVLEQIVGEIVDEHDSEHEYLVRASGDNQWIVKGLMPVEELNTQINSQFSDEEYDTIGGLVTHHFGYLPAKDEEVVIGSVRFKVLSADNRSIHLLEITSPKLLAFSREQTSA